jgi:hypothetical protein
MSSFFSSLLSKSPNNIENEQESIRNLIEKICNKMNSSIHLEDRRAGAQTLKSLSKQNQLVKKIIDII